MPDECQHGPNEDCMFCSECGECSETLDEDDVCQDCRDIDPPLYRLENDDLLDVAGELVEHLDNVTASLENCLGHLGCHMTPADFTARTRLAKEARAMADKYIRRHV